MEIITCANETILTILRKFIKPSDCVRTLKYLVEVDLERGVLLFNLLTRELLLLDHEEYKNLHSQQHIKDHFFMIPEKAIEKELADLVRWVLSTRTMKEKAITHYTIFTTTDCNARCFYCFELGRSRIPMSCDTALRVVEYIREHCGGEAVSISWFGGEPLYNLDVIDTICEGLHRTDVEFKSTMVSNGYLFNDEIVRRATETWNLKQVQISLDGTERVYNKAKAYIYKDGSPYQVVLENIDRLLDASVSVQIRLNMDLYNADDLLLLVEELSQRFKAKKGLYVYAHHLFKSNEPMAKTHTDEEWEKRDAAMQRLEAKIAESGLQAKRGISKHPKLNHCVADSGKGVTILPDGNIGLCEQFSEDEFIGHIDREGFDTEMVASWKERTPEIPECGDCFYYPECIKLKKCPSGSTCFRQLREDQLRKTKRQMLNEYKKWLQKTQTDDSDETDFC